MKEKLRYGGHGTGGNGLSAPGASRAAGRGGFSLIELLVVLNISAWMAWVSITALWGVSGGISINRKVSDLQSFLELARSQAMQLNTYVYVGVFESDGRQDPSARPLSTGVGRVWVGAVATRDGTPGCDPSDPNSRLDPSNLMPIGRLQQLENVHLNDRLPFRSGSMLTNSLLVSGSPPLFGWPANTKSTIQGFSAGVIRFDPRGSAALTGSSSLPEGIQLPLLPSKGGMIPSGCHDAAVIQVDAVSGIVKSFRPDLS